MASPIHGFQTEGIPGSPAALWFYKTDPDIFSSPEYSVNVASVLRIETTHAHTPVTITFSGNITILLGDPATNFISDLNTFVAAGGVIPVVTLDGLLWTPRLSGLDKEIQFNNHGMLAGDPDLLYDKIAHLLILSSSDNPFGGFGDQKPQSKLYVGVPEASLNPALRGYFGIGDFVNPDGEGGATGGIFTSIGGVSLIGINESKPSVPHMGVAVYALGLRHNTTDDGVAAMGGDSYNDSGGNAIGVHGYVSSLNVPASSLYGFLAFHNDGAATGISAGYYSQSQAGTSSTLNAAFYAADQGAGANDCAFYSAGGKSLFAGPTGALGIGPNAVAQINADPSVRFYCGTDPTAFNGNIPFPSSTLPHAFAIKGDGTVGIFAACEGISNVAMSSTAIETGNGISTGVSGNVLTFGVSSAGGITGLQSVVSHFSSSTLDSIIGVDVTSATNAGGAITESYGVRIGAQNVATTSYGLHIANQGSGATDYSIFSAGGKNILVGPVGIGINATAQTVLSALYINHFAGSNSATWTSTFLNNPDGIAFDATGNLYFCGMGNPVFKADPITQTLVQYAGGGGNHGAPNWFGVGGLSLASWLWQAGNLAVDKTTGVVYMVQQDGCFLEAFDPITGIMTNVAGTPTVSGGSYSGDGGPAISAGFNAISAIALDANGNIVIGNTAVGGGKVRVINMGTTSASFWGVTIAPGNIDAVATHDYVSGLAIDSGGNLFVGGNGGAPSISKITPAGVSTTFAGGHTFAGSYSGDGGPATSAVLGTVTGISVDASDNVFFQSNAAIHKVDKNTGIITTIAGTSDSPGFTGDGGLATSAQMLGTTNGFYTQTAFDAAGDLFVTDGSTTANACIRKIDMDTGIITSIIRFVPGAIPIPISGLAVDAQLQYPFGMETDSAGNVYFCNDGFNAVCKIAPNGTYSVIAGTGIGSYTGDGGPATVATLFDPEGMTILPDASIMYIADSSNDVIRKVDMNTGTITTYAGVFNSYTYSGRGGPATSADFNYIENVTVDAAGNLYLSDSGNNVISKIDKNTGIITDIAGDFGTYGTSGGYAGDGGPATAAALMFPCGLRFDAAGNLYIADYYNAAIRKVDTGGTITTFAGTGVVGYSGDGGLATSAQLSFPFDVAVDAVGNVYITDTGNSVVRKVNTGGIITTISGPGLGIPFGDGGPAINAGINTLWNLCIHAGTLYISEGGTFGFIRKIASDPSTAVQFWCGTDPTGLDSLFSLPSGLRTRAFAGKNDEAPGLFVGTQDIGTAVALECQSVVSGAFGSGWGLKVTASSSATAPSNNINNLTGIQVNVDHHSSGNCAAITGLLVNAATVGGTVETVAGIKIAPQTVGLNNFGLLIEDQGSGYAVHSAGGRVNISGLPSYTDNAAALAAGLGRGDVYRLGDTVGVVH